MLAVHVRARAAVRGGGARWTAARADNTIKVWRDGACVRLGSRPWQQIVKVRTQRRSLVAVLPCGVALRQRLVATARLWTVTRGCRHGVHCGRGAARRNFVVVAWLYHDGEVRLYHVDGTLIHTFKGHTDYVNAVAVTPDGQHIISGSGDRLVKVWSVATKSLVSTCRRAHRLVDEEYVIAVAAMPDGQRILSGGVDKTVRVWLLNGTHQNTFELHTSGS